MFSNLGKITIFFNEMFNNHLTSNLKPRELYTFLKEIVIRHNLKKSDLAYISLHKKDITIQNVREKLPYLKSYEIRHILSKMEQISEYAELIRSLDLEKSKIVKINKSKGINT